MGLTVTTGKMPLLSVAVGIVQFASAVPLIFNETRISKGQVLSKDGGVTSAKKYGQRSALGRVKFAF